MSEPIHKWWAVTVMMQQTEQHLAGATTNYRTFLRGQLATSKEEALGYAVADCLKDNKDFHISGHLVLEIPPLPTTTTP